MKVFIPFSGKPQASYKMPWGAFTRKGACGKVDFVFDKVNISVEGSVNDGGDICFDNVQEGQVIVFGQSSKDGSEKVKQYAVVKDGKAVPVDWKPALDLVRKGNGGVQVMMAQPSAPLEQVSRMHLGSGLVIIDPAMMGNQALGNSMEEFWGNCRQASATSGSKDVACLTDGLQPVATVLTLEGDFCISVERSGNGEIASVRITKTSK